MESINLEFIVIFFLSASCGITLTLLLLLKKEARTLQHATRSLLRTDRARSGVVIKAPEMLSLWRSILALHSNIRNLESTDQIANEALELSSSVSSASYDFSSAVGQAVAAVMRQASPEIVGCALLFREDEKQALSLECCRGVPGTRVEEPLTTFVDILINQNDNNSWGYHNPEANSLVDFSVFEISTQLFLPLRIDNQIYGALWLGFRKATAGLNSKRMDRLRAFSVHAIAAIKAALESTKKFDSKNLQYNSILGMSHDLRAPGNSALYALYDLKEESCGHLNEEQISRLDTIENEIKEQLSLLDDILDFAKSENHQLRAQISARPLKPLLDELISKYQPLATAKDLPINLDEIPQCAIMVDQQQFKRILSNILSNAVKYTHHGSISIELQWHNNKLQLSVIDTGIGVPKNEQEFLFKEFQRASNTNQIQGIGLGLALSKRLVELNEGKIHYSPRRDGGSIFSMTFRALPLSELGPIPGENREGLIKSVLIVDDDPAVCRTNARYLKDIAEQIITAYNYQDARQILETSRPELLVSDFNLGDGTALNLISDFHQFKLSIPTLILTGSNYSLELDNYLSSKTPISVMQKPVPREQICSKVLELLNRVS